MENPRQNQEDSFIVIPNPIYDVVFRYLMEDNLSARVILSTLINENIKKLTFEPASRAERVYDPKTDRFIRLFHLDFIALIEKPDGREELVMIELQKANKASDIFRFKRYISANFQRKHEKEVTNPRTQAIEKVNTPIKLLPIFILNFRIENEVNDLMIRTTRDKMGVFRGKGLTRENEFIDNLSFDIWVVQLPNLRRIAEEDYRNDEYKSKLFQLLKLFDQEAQNKKNKHRLMLAEGIFPKFLERVINRLKSADADNPDLEEQMNAEDEYLSELIKRDNEISFFRQELEKTAEELGKTTEELGKTTEELEKERELRMQKDMALNEKDRIILEMARSMKASGKSTDEIHQLTRLDPGTIGQL